MNDLVTQLGRTETFVLLIVAIPVICGAVIAVTAIIATQWRKVHQAEIEASLKHEMLNRGMSAEEIALVMRTAKWRSSHIKEVADEVERVIQAVKTPAAGRCG